MALLAIALIVLTVLALLLAGAFVAALTGVVLLNVFATIVCSRSRALRRLHATQAGRWRPSSFRLPPEPTDEGEHDPAQSLTIHRR